MSWTLLSNHAHVLHEVACDPAIRLRDIADRVGITERAVHRIVCELEDAGYLTRRHVGARNTYEVHATPELGDRLEHQIRVADVLDLLLKDAGTPLPGVTSTAGLPAARKPSLSRDHHIPEIAAQGA